MTDLTAPSNASDAAAALNGSFLFPADDAAGQTVAAMAESEKISADEIALYDRQIRLWGVKAQEKIRTANILLVSIKALANEIAKNLVLAGIGSITLADHENVSEDDLGAQFFISDADVGKNRAEAAAPQVRKLNPRVKVNTYTSPITTETEASFYAQFDVIIATDLDFNSTNTLNLCARLANRPFYAGASHGLYGYIFADLIQHKFVVERDLGNKTTQVGPESSTRSILETSSKKENGKSVETVTKQEIYSPIMAIKDSPLPPELANNQRRLRKVHPLLTCVRALWEYQFKAHGVLPSHDPQQLQLFTMMATDKHKLHMLPSSTLTAEFLRSFLQNLGSEIAPVTAFLGGQLAQDVINVLGQREQPIQNLLLFDGEECAGPVYALHPIFADNPIAALPSIPMPVEAIAIDD